MNANLFVNSDPVPWFNNGTPLELETKESDQVLSQSAKAQHGSQR
jgi:hypothetical protein